MGVTFKIDMNRYIPALQRALVQRTGVAIRRRAKELVRVDSHELQNSIRFDFTKPPTYGEVSSNVAHGAAQEWGRPDLPRYGFTPHMRPSAKQIVEEDMPQIVKDAEADALRECQV